MMRSEPKYVHDCDRCAFLGNFRDGEWHWHDLYFCWQYGRGTVIARASSQGSDYVSGSSAFFFQNNAPLAFAVELTIAYLAKKLVDNNIPLK